MDTQELKDLEALFVLSFQALVQKILQSSTTSTCYKQWGLIKRTEQASACSITH